MNAEKRTRKEIIDLNLLRAGWQVGDLSQVVEEYGVKIISGTNQVDEPSVAYQQFADYLLKDRHGKALAVVEAKKTSHDAKIGRERARQYAEQIQVQQNGELTFCFYTNGHDIFFRDIDHYPPRKIYGFPTRDDLEPLRYLRRYQKPLAGELINTSVAGRDYQLQAIRSVMEGLEQQRRRFLLVMATSTGKTRTCVALVDVLMRAGWIERTLFLVDQIALRDQALDAFREYLPDEPRWPVNDEADFARDRRIYVATYQTILNLIRDCHTYLSPHFFDLIVVEKSHRSIYNVYRDILDYFNAVTLGLTATPTNLIDRNTFDLFGCEDGMPTFAFMLDEAIRHVPPYLCDFQAMAVQTHLQDKGLNQRTISLDDQEAFIRGGRDISEVNYEGSELERTVTNRDTNTVMVREFMETCIKDPNGLPGKTIFFCVSKAHARRIEEIVDTLYPQFRGELARVVVSDDPRVYGKNGLLAQFNEQDFPRIAISVDMLDTGIDIRELVNLVFAKPIFSYTKFWQMVGRGTRLLEARKLKPWCTRTQKDVFLILDCWNNFAYFKLEPYGRELPAQISLVVRLFRLRLDTLQEAIDRGLTETIQHEMVQLRRLLALLPAQSVVVMEARQELLPTEDDEFWQHLTPYRIDHLRQRIQPLVRMISGVDYKAMRFEKNVIEAGLARLRNETDRYDLLRDGLISYIGELPLSVNVVAQEEPLIRQTQAPAFWARATSLNLAQLIDQLAPFMRYAESGVVPLSMAAYNFRDAIAKRERVEFGPERESLGLAQYRQLVEDRVRSLTSFNPYLQKLQQGQALSNSEISALAAQLEADKPHVTLDNLRRIYQNRRASYEQLMRHIIGLEQLETFSQAVTLAFAEFILAHSDLSSRQMQFLDVLKSYLLEKGEVARKDLIHAPFTALHPSGIRGLFPPNQIDEIIQLTQTIAA